MIGRLLSLALVLVLQLHQVRPAIAQEPQACQAEDLPTNRNGELKAFQGPDSKETEVAAKWVIGIFCIAFFGSLLLLFFWVYFYEPKEGLSKPTVVRRGKNYVPYQRQSEPEKTRYNIDEQ